MCDTFQGYLQLFGLTLAIMVYGFVNSDWKDWMTWSVAAVVVLDFAFEWWIFPRKTYLEFKPINRVAEAPSKNAAPK